MSLVHRTPSALRRLARTPAAAVLALLRDESAQALADYALVAATIGILMIAVMVTMQHTAANNLDNTQTGLSNEANNP